MKIIPTPHRRKLSVLVPTLMVLAAPVSAQEVQTTTTPPPAVSTAPQQSAPTAAESPAIVRGPSTPVVQDVPDTTRQPASDDTAVRRAAPATATRAAAPRATAQRSASARVTTARAAAPAAAAKPTSAPVAQTASAPAATEDATPAAQTPAPAAQAPAANTAPASDTAPVATADSTQTTTQAAPVWPWIAAGIVGLLAIIGLVALSRRRKEPHYEEAYVEPQSVAEPAVYDAPLAEPTPVIEPAIASAPLAEAPFAAAAYEEPKYVQPEPGAERIDAERIDDAPVTTLDEAPVATADSAEIVSADAADVDALTAGDPPVADRPWLEMAMRPVRAGTSAEDALVEIELTVGNAGSVAAKNVRISTFMFAGEPDGGEMERMIVERDGEAVPPVTIAAGEGTTLEATLSLSRELLDGEISPVIVADARYPLPGGGEGHTSASFRIGISQEDGSISPIQIGKPHMTQTVDAELYGTPERV